MRLKNLLLNAYLFAREEPDTIRSVIQIYQKEDKMDIVSEYLENNLTEPRLTYTPLIRTIIYFIITLS